MKEQNIYLSSLGATSIGPSNFLTCLEMQPRCLAVGQSCPCSGLRNLLPRFGNERFQVDAKNLAHSADISSMCRSRCAVGTYNASQPNLNHLVERFSIPRC